MNSMARAGVMGAALLGATLIAADAHADRVIDNGDYYEVREKARAANLTELQRAKMCERLTGMNVSFYSWVAEVRADGAVVVDMDDSVLSLPEVVLLGVSESRASQMQRNERIRYTGTISGCAFDGVTLALRVRV